MSRMHGGNKGTDKGKKGKLTRKAMTMDYEPKDRTKSRTPKQKPGFKKRRGKS